MTAPAGFPPPDRAAERFAALFGPEFGAGFETRAARGLDPLREALACMGAPEQRLPPVAHIAGTNGKGSTAAFITAIAAASGLRVHAFTQPHLIFLRERFLCAGHPAMEADLIAAAEAVHRAGPSLSQFEAQTAVAFALMAHTPADLAVIEVGCGGRDDGTNVLPRPAVSVITPIAEDHIAILGPTLEDIATHKAGVIKPGAPVVSAVQEPTVEAVLRRAAARAGAPLLIEGQDWAISDAPGGLTLQAETFSLDLPRPRLLGAHQRQNLGLAAMALFTWGDPRITTEGLCAGARNAALPGRFTPLAAGPLAAQAGGAALFVDGGHNPHAGQALCAALQTLGLGPAIGIVGMLADKDHAAFLAALAPALQAAWAVPVRGPRVGAPVEVLAGLVAELGLPARAEGSLPAALAAASKACPGAPILICGSFALAGEALWRNTAPALA